MVALPKEIGALSPGVADGPLEETEVPAPEAADESLDTDRLLEELTMSSLAVDKEVLAKEGPLIVAESFSSDVAVELPDLAEPVIVKGQPAEASDKLIATNAPPEEAETLPPGIFDESLETDTPLEGLNVLSPAMVVGLLGSAEDVLSIADPVNVDESPAEVADEILGTKKPLDVTDAL